MLVLLEELQSEEWWQDVTVVMLEQVRKKLREPPAAHREAVPEGIVHGL